MSKSKDLWKFEADGEPFAKLCVDLTVYWKGSMFDRSDGIADFYEHAMAELRPHLRFYETETMKGARPVKADVFDMLPTWLSAKAKRRDIYLLQLEGGSRPNEPAAYSFTFKANSEKSSPGGALRLSVPPAVVEREPSWFVGLAERLIRNLNYDSGHGGYSLNWDPRGDFTTEANEAMLSIRNRYLGVDLPHLTATVIAVKNAAEPGLRCANWLTLLGRTLLERAGGEDQVRASLPAGCDVIAVTHGVMIRAGEAPSLGDAHREADLSLYRAVGQLVTPLRLDNHPEFIEDPSDPEGEPTRDWLARFDE